MQPEQQNYPPSNGSQQNPNVPDFFQLDPIEESKSHKKAKLIILTALILLIVGGIVGVVFVWLQGESERRFYRAIDNAMHTRYVEREYTMKFQDSDGRATMNAKTDFSRMKEPKTQLSYEYSWIDDASGDITTETKLTGDQMYLDTGSFFGRLTAAPTSLTQNGINLDQWYEIDIDIENISPLDLLLFSTTINTPFGHVLMANFPDDERKQLSDFIESEKVYTIEGSRSAKLAGKIATEYSITIDVEKYTKLSRKVTDPTGVFSRFDMPTDDNQTQPMTVWVDNETDRILEIAYSEEDQYTVEVTYDYPSSTPVTIERPQSVKRLNEHVQ